MSQGFTKGTPIDTDPTLSLNSDIVVPSQKAVKSYLAANYQPTLVSGTNIKTVNGNSLLGSGDLVVGGGGLTIGTTAITSGTDGRVLFQSGGVVQQDSGFFWDNTNKRLGVGATPATSVRLDVRAQGALSTDIGFRVRNSADTANILSVQGNGRIGVSTTSPLAKLHISSDDFGQDLFRVTYAAGSVDMMNIRSAGFSTGTVTFAPPDGVVCNSTLKMGFNNILGSTTSYIQIENPGGGNQSMNFRTASASANLGFQFLNSSGNQIFQITNSGNVSIGATTPAARLDVRAQGALSTDIAFRVRNSADSDNIIQVNGNNTIFFLGADGGGLRFSRPTGHNILIQHRPIATLPSQLILNSFGQGGSVPQIIFDAQGAGTNISFNIHRYTFGLSTLTGSSIQSAFGATTSAGFFMRNSVGYDGGGTNPTTTPADHFIMYSADIVAGNAAPHFRTENGNIIRLFQGAALTASDGTLANAVTRIAEIQARLQAHGLIA
jgi:hypothetical protein